MNKPDILCFSSSDWHGKWGSRQQVMLRFARRGYRVLFIERQAGLEHLWKYPDLRRRKWQRWREGLREISPNLWIASLPPVLPGRYYSLALNRLNQRLVVRWMRPIIRRLHFDQPILWLYKPEHAPLIGRFDEQLVVYHCIDEFTAGTRGRKRRIIETMETELLRRADLVFANSRLTYENKRQLNPNTYRIPSGADVVHFGRVTDPDFPVHADTTAIPRPILAYIGNVNERIDIELLAAVAVAHPHWSLVLIGQLYPQTVDLSPLRRCSNVHLLGKRPFETLPSLLKGADVCLLPYVQGEATRYRSPLKLYEYLATGKPIVSTDQPEVREFSDLVFIAGDKREFENGVSWALKEDTLELREERLQTAREHSWDKRVETMSELVMQRLLGKSGCLRRNQDL